MRNGISPFYLMLVFILVFRMIETPPRSSLAPLDEIERMEENSEFIARNLGKLDSTVGDMVKMKHHDRLKLEFKWKGPYHVVDVGHPGTYWIMTPQGLRLPNAVNQK
ncbi:hypothetical protein BASA83_008261 [Batrachochytrium salamandrivorans]|nr:hypothetical protein BASA83_008261 [Batrachochytrium salamandrivorans]